MPDMENFSELCGMQDACALAGAAAFFAGIPDAAVVINGPLWCYYYAMRHIEMNEPLISKRMLCTQLDNEAIVFGSEEYLRDTLAPYAEKPPSVLCIANNCSASLIGDDVLGIARELGISCPITAPESGGLIGGFAEGWQRASLSLLDEVSFGAEEKIPFSVNLLGVTGGYYNGLEDAEELKRLLTLAGYHVQACPGAGMAFADFSKLSCASLNIVVHRELGMPLARKLHEMFGTPYIAPLPPYGISGTRQWMDAVNDALEAPAKSDFESVCAKTEQRIFLRIGELKGIWDELWYDEAIVSGTETSAAAFAQALRGEWADIGRLTLIHPAGRKPENYSAADDILDAGKDIDEIKKRFSDMKQGIVAASSNETTQLTNFTDGKIEVFPIAYPVFDSMKLSDAPFMGLRGAAYVQEVLWNAKIHEIARNVASEK